jgi:hypothetical protein
MWYVWNRYITSKGEITAWCDVPKQYKTKKSAHLAVRDLLRQAEDTVSLMYPHSTARFEYLALPQDMKPRHDMLLRYV